MMLSQDSGQSQAYRRMHEPPITSCVTDLNSEHCIDDADEAVVHLRGASSARSLCKVRIQGRIPLGRDYNQLDQLSARTISAFQA